MSNPDSALQAEELIAWNESSARRWRAYAAANPAVLAVPCDIHRAKTVGELLQHIVTVELRFAERLSGLPITEYVGIPFASADEIYGVHDRAMQLLRALLAQEGYDWREKLEFPTLTAGFWRAPRRAILFHALLHGMRHYAQLNTLARQAGFDAGVAGDYLLMDSERMEGGSK